MTAFQLLHLLCAACPKTAFLAAFTPNLLLLASPNARMARGTPIAKPIARKSKTATFARARDDASNSIRFI